MKRIITLDLGTKTGWAFTRFEKDGKSSILSGRENFNVGRYESSGIRFVKFGEFLHKVSIRTDIYEETIFYFEEVRRHMGVDAAHVYGGFMAVLQSFCIENDYQYHGVPVGTIKKHATGKGNASKEEMIEEMRKKGHDVLDDNQADALALMHFVLDKFIK